MGEAKRNTELPIVMISHLLYGSWEMGQLGLGVILHILGESYFVRKKMVTIGFSWDALITIGYADIFRDIFDIEGWIGIPVEVGNDFYYRHVWPDIISGDGLTLVIL